MTRPSFKMALFGMIWLLRVRSEIKRCAKCRRDCSKETFPCSTYFSVDPAQNATVSPTTGPTTYCEVHGYNPPEEGKNIEYRKK